MKNIAYDLEQPYNPIIEKSLESWLNAQRIGITAYWTMISQPPQINVVKELGTSLRAFLMDTAGNEHSSRLMNMPPSVLHLLNTLLTEAPGNAPNNVRHLHTQIISTLLTLTKKRRGNPSFLYKSQIIAYQILYSRTLAHQIISFCLNIAVSSKRRSRTGKRWREILNNDVTLTRINKNLDTIRNSSHTLPKLMAISELGDNFRQSPWWPQVENILLTHTFYWPLLVPKGEANIGFSLPVAIEINLDGRNKIDFRGINAGKIKHSGIDISEWEPHLKKSVNAAWMLWLDQHRNYGHYRQWRNNHRDFRYMLENATIQFNFYWANRILKSILLSVGEGSADTYFAMAVLAKFLGRRSSLSSAITGLIGEKCTALDYWVKPPRGIKAKFRYIFASNTFQRLIYPKDEATLEEVHQLATWHKSIQGQISSDTVYITQTASMLPRNRLSDFADIAQVDGWRHYRYIRCPDIEWAVHSLDQITFRRDDDDFRLLEVAQLLKKNSHPILDWRYQESITPYIFAFTLAYVNQILRNEILIEIRPPRISYLFIRITREHDHHSFWEIVWRAIGAPLSDFEEFIFARDTAHAARLFSHALNHFQPSSDSVGYRSPDIFVIVGAEHLPSPDEMSLFDQRLNVTAVLNELCFQGILDISPHLETIEESLVGRTRIVLLSDTIEDNQDVPNTEIILKRLTQKERIILRALSIFRFGFNHYTANLLMRDNKIIKNISMQDDFMKILFVLQNKGALRFHIDRYHVPFPLREKLQSSFRDDVEKAICHQLAGLSIAPCTSNTYVPSIDLDHAFLSENVHEANFHFNQAIKLSHNALDQEVKTRSSYLKVRLLQFCAYPSDYVIDELYNTDRPYKSEAYPVLYISGMQNINQLKKRSSSIHPSHYVNILKPAFWWRFSPNITESVVLKLDNELDNEVGLFVEGLEACTHVTLPEIQKRFRLIILSIYASYLLRKEPQSLVRLNNIDDEIIYLLKTTGVLAAKDIFPETFERVGNRIDSHIDALRIYHLGIQWAPTWRQLWILALGSSVLATGSTDTVLEALDTYIVEQSSVQGYYSVSREHMIFQILKEINSYGPPFEQPSSWVIQRWHEGLRVINYTWGHNPDIHHEVDNVLQCI